MPLIKSIAGVRGTIGGKPDDGLTPIDIVKITTSFAEWIKKDNGTKKVIVGRDGRISGDMIKNIVNSTLLSLGVDVIDIGLSTTPTVEMAVIMEKAGGGIIITASHNPKGWNALKLLNKNGEFVDAENGKWILDFSEKGEFEYADENNLGLLKNDDSFIDKHIKAIIDYDLVIPSIVKDKKFKVVVDAINSTGAIAVPRLLNALGVFDVIVINKEVNGNFAHNPEPLPENLTELSKVVIDEKADIGISVDPDVDRLSFVCEDGTFFGEDYTLVAVADYFLSYKKTNTVSNLSSTMALRDVTEKYNQNYFASAVGEVNVVSKMKEVGALIGGEGNGGVIVSDLHYGRDALIGIALFLTSLAKSNLSVSEFRKKYPFYFMSKNKIKLDKEKNISNIFDAVKNKYKNYKINLEDGLRIELENGWVHLRTSNTEPIIRVYSEGKTFDQAEKMAKDIMDDVATFSK